MRVTTRARSSATAAFAAALGLSLAGIHRSSADPLISMNDGPRLKLLSPAPRTDFHGTRPIEIDALYEGTPGNGIVSLDLYIDGVKAQSQVLNSPETKGIVSFLVDSSLISPGTHYVVVRATAADAEVRSVRGEFIYGSEQPASNLPASSAGDEDALSWPSLPGAAPQLRLMYPLRDSKVQGTVTIKVDANDEDSRTPYVSIFIDGDMKQLVNYRPFEYTWDTSTLPNGWHTIAVAEAFDNDSTPIARIEPIRVYVNNPGGDTYIRTDLMDGAKPYKPAVSAPQRLERSRKTLVSAPLTRRPRGAAWLAPGLSAKALPLGQEDLMAAADPRWDGLSAVLEPSLSAPTLAGIPAQPTLNTRIAQTARPHHGEADKPLTASLSAGEAIAGLSKPHQSPLLIAENPTLEEALSSPILALPEDSAAAAPHKVLAAVPHAPFKSWTQRVVTSSPSISSLKLRIQTPALPLRTPEAVRPHVALGDTSLLQAVGQTRVVFNHTSLALERPLAVKDNIMFGPLRRLFEQGGGTLQWQAHSGIVQARTATRDIKMTIGNRRAIVNHQAFTLSSAPYIDSGRTMVPVSFLSVALNANVQYDPATGHLKITSRQ